MRYFKDQGQVFGYDESDDSQAPFIQNAIQQVLEEVTGGWPPPPTFAQVQASQSDAIESAYQQAIQLPVEYLGSTFQADDYSQNVLTKSLVAGSVPNGFFWLDANNAEVPMTFAQLQGLAAAMLAQGQTAFAKKVSLKSKIATATTVTGVKAIVWATP